MNQQVEVVSSIASSTWDRAERFFKCYTGVRVWPSRKGWTYRLCGKISSSPIEYCIVHNAIAGIPKICSRALSLTEHYPRFLSTVPNVERVLRNSTINRLPESHKIAGAVFQNGPDSFLSPSLYKKLSCLCTFMKMKWS